MYCRTCGNEMQDTTKYCQNCGKEPHYGENFCQNCGSGMNQQQDICLNCGVSVQNTSIYSQIKSLRSHMHCRNCGNKIDINADFCINCGTRPLNATAYCQDCGGETKSEEANCFNCGAHLKHLEKPRRVTPEYTEGFPTSSTYYEKEFKKIETSKESYKGKWNWPAFLFGGFWALSKGLWVIFIIHMSIVFLIQPGLRLILIIIMTIVLGKRGNYLVFRKKNYNEQLPKDMSELF